MYCSGFSRRLARHRLALPISLLLGTAISSMSLAAEVDINDGDNYLSAGDVVDILGLVNVGIIANHAGFTIGSAPDNAVEVTGDLGIFINGGTILGADRGVLVGGIVTSFTNAAGGLIESAVDTAVHLQGTVGDFTNAGVIKGEWLMALSGALSLLLGFAIMVLLVIDPLSTLPSAAWVIGISSVRLPSMV